MIAKYSVSKPNKIRESTDGGGGSAVIDCWMLFQRTCLPGDTCVSIR